MTSSILRPRIIALGQPLAGDDAAGLAVAARLRAAGVAVIEVASVTDLVTALEAPGDVILVDAVLGDEPGRVLVLAPEQLGRDGVAAVSSHGIDVPAAIALAATLYPETAGRTVRLVGVVIDRAPRFTEGLSSAVENAIHAACERVLALCGAAPNGV